MDEQAVANASQIQGWDGPEGDNWVENEAFYNASSRAHTERLFDVAAITASERILDVGCGTGQTTRRAARIATNGYAFGIDLSRRMIERARERAREEGVANVRFERGDAQVYRFDPEGFDVVISRFGCMFFDDPVAAFSNISRALVPGARAALLTWRGIGDNEWIREIRDALAAGRSLPEPPPNGPSPFAFADPERVRGILEASGFTSAVFDPVDDPVYFGPDEEIAFESIQRLGIVRGTMQDLEPAVRARVLDAVRASAASHATPDGVFYQSSGWLIRAEKARR